VIRCCASTNPLRTFAVGGSIHSAEPNLGPNTQPDGLNGPQASQISASVFRCSRSPPEGIYARDANCIFNTASAFGARACVRAKGGAGLANQDPPRARPGGKVAAVCMPMVIAPRPRPLKQPDPILFFIQKILESEYARNCCDREHDLAAAG
jgi:hypothetical protein